MVQNFWDTLYILIGMFPECSASSPQLMNRSSSPQLQDRSWGNRHGRRNYRVTQKKNVPNFDAMFSEKYSSYKMIFDILISRFIVVAFSPGRGKRYIVGKRYYVCDIRKFFPLNYDSLKHNR